MNRIQTHIQVLDYLLKNCSLLVRVREGFAVQIANQNSAYCSSTNSHGENFYIKCRISRRLVIYYNQALGGACSKTQNNRDGTTGKRTGNDWNHRNRNWTRSEQSSRTTTSQILVSMRKSHCIHLAFLFPNFLNMSLTFRIYKTTIRPSFHLIEFNKQIVLFSCKFEKKIALFRLAFPCLPSD
jgi:hypothetical protein